MSFNWQDYIEVQDGPGAENVRKSLDEMAATPEGCEIIRKAAENLRNAHGDPDRKMVFTFEDNLTAAYTDGRINVGESEGILRYMGKDGQFHDMSIQSIVFHEIAHFALGGKSPDNERPTIEETNKYMKKYYGEPERDPDAHGWLDPSKVDLSGTKGWDWNPDFDADHKDVGKQPEAYPEFPEFPEIPEMARGNMGYMPEESGSGLSVLEQFRNFPPQMAETLPPELYSLWEVRDNAAAFAGQLKNVFQETDAEMLYQDLQEFHERFEEHWNEIQMNGADPQILPQGIMGGVLPGNGR